MTDILQIFSGNPLATFVGKKVEAATREDLESEDWALNLEICDIINDNDDDAKDAVRAIRKRLHQIEQDSNFTITDRTLTVLETCVSNCSHRFHVLVMTKDFIQDLVKLIGPKNNPPISLQERVLRLIERWAEAFRSQPDLGGVVSVYNDLKSKGVTFPVRDPNSSVPIQTPRRSVHPTAATPAATTRQDVRLLGNTRETSGAGPPQSVQSHQSAVQVILEGEHYNKISQDLTVVESSIEMFNDILRVLESPKNEDSDWQLGSELAATCRQMKDRIVELIERVANEDLTMEMLRLNDELNNIFIKYDRLVKNRAKSSGRQTTSTERASNQSEDSSQRDKDKAAATAVAAATAKPVGVSSRTLNDLSLIDFNTSGGAEAKKEPQAMAASTAGPDPFDTSNILPSSTSQTHPLADELSRLSLSKTDETKTKAVTGNTKQSGLPDEISSVREQDFAEIENWLQTDSSKNVTTSGDGGGGDLPSIEPISIPNSEFENFLANRALAGSNAGSSSNSNEQQEKSKHQPEPSV